MSYHWEVETASLGAKNDRLAAALVTARGQIAELQRKLEEVLRSPSTYGTFIRPYEDEREADVMVSGRKMRLPVVPQVDLAAILPGQEVRLNENMNIVASGSGEDAGEIALVREVLDEERILISTNHGDERVVRRGDELVEMEVTFGDAVIVDVRTNYATAKVQRSEIEEFLLEETPDTQYSEIGGLDDEIGQIRDAIELPFVHPELYRQYELKPPKGVLLYGPPGTGKTLIAKAVATSLAKTVGGNNGTSYFLNIKGPELLNKFVGETERQIRTLFARARERAKSGVPVIIFFDEMESLFRIRGAGISSDVETTVVPQLLTEIDGVEELDNVVVIGATNREDMIDPAILRPGRLDLKIRIDRPNEEGARDIFSKYLTPRLPIAASEVAEHGSVEAAVDAMIAQAVDRLYCEDPSMRYAEVVYADGTVEILYVKDFVSGALIAGAVDRAKKRAIKDFLETGESGISLTHVWDGLEEELRESEELRASTDPEQWARITGRRSSGRVVGVRVLRDDSQMEYACGSDGADSEPIMIPVDDSLPDDSKQVETLSLGSDAL